MPYFANRFFGVKQGCPLSPLLFSICLNDIVDSVTDGAQGALTGIYTVKHMLFADDLSLPSNEYADLHARLNKLRVYAERKSLTVITQMSEVLCSSSNSQNLPLLLYFDGVLLPYTDSFKYSGMVCDKQINLNTAADAALCPFTAGTFRVKEFVQKHNNRQHTYM